MEKFHNSSRPTLLFEESDILKRTVLACVDKKYNRLLIDDFDVYQKSKLLYKKFSREHNLRIEYYRDKVPMFERFNVEREIEKATRRKIWLPGGGYLFFERTEAMYTIDVNSGRSSNVEGNVEEALVQINLEAADEISRQLRLRNIGGLVIVDFIDMKFRKNQRRVLDKLKECMKEDVAKCTILSMSEFGLVEMTRQRNRESLIQTMFTSCPYCNGSALIKSHESISIEIERSLHKVIHCQQQFSLKLVVHPELYQYLEKEGDREFLIRAAQKEKAKLEFDVSDLLHLNDYHFYSLVTGALIEF